MKIPIEQRIKNAAIGFGTAVGKGPNLRSVVGGLNFNVRRNPVGNQQPRLIKKSQPFLKDNMLQQVLFFSDGSKVIVRV